MSRARPALSAAVLALSTVGLLAGCGGSGLQTTSTGGPVQTPAASPTNHVNRASQATNPVWPSNFPDPQILPDGDGWVAIATNGNGMN
ncbi:MAG: hypothetical protein HOQ27_10740, partial [Dermatophilaceae bacterium]|nr:hypothetical protein [Dermatophilaceae bacterium]